MCMGPDGYLYIAAHVSDGGNYVEPTPQSTGAILRQRLDATGSFAGPLHDAFSPTAGILRTPDLTDPTSFGPQLNRPAEPRFCSHGCLHVSSFIGPKDRRRRVYKFGTELLNCSDVRLRLTRCFYLGWLWADQGGDELLEDAWGLDFSSKGVTISCHGPSAIAPVVRLASCGC